MGAPPIAANPRLAESTPALRGHCRELTKIIIISALQKTDADIEAKWKSMWRPVPQGDALCQLV